MDLTADVLNMWTGLFSIYGCAVSATPTGDWLRLTWGITQHVTALRLPTFMMEKVDKNVCIVPHNKAHKSIGI